MSPLASESVSSLALLASLAFALSGCVTAVRHADHDTLIAHRGESFDAPENTLPAYRMAVDRGFGFECDIYRSRDGRLFTFHDGDLRRTTGGVHKEKCTAADWETTVSKVNVGGWGKWKGSRFDPTRPALFEEVLALARPGRKIYVEVKGGDTNWVPLVRATLAKEPRATPETVLFIAFSDRVCAELKRQIPAYKVYWLTGGKNATAESVIAKLRKIGADGVDIAFDESLHSADFVKEVHDAGYEFHVWTIDSPARAAEAFRRGADSVTTNRARYIYETLNGKGKETE